MTNISKRLEQTLSSAIQKNPIIPQRVAEGILVGDVLIINEGTVKHLKQHNEFKYKEISLNCAAIRIANLLARRSSTILADQIYTADQEYGRWFVDSQMLRSQYQKALNNQDNDRADMLWAKYSESRDRAVAAKKRTESLANI
jgi:hypothetical protein